MGNRVSIQFKNKERISPALFSHWGGERFVEDAREYAEKLKARGKSEMYPLDRREPGTVMVDFISKFTKGEEVSSDLYLGVDEEDGDNSDNGNFVIDLEN